MKVGPSAPGFLADQLPDGNRFQIRLWNAAGSFEAPMFAVAGKLIEGEVRSAAVAGAR